MTKWEYCTIGSAIRGERAIILGFLRPSGPDYRVIKEARDIGLSEEVYQKWERRKLTLPGKQYILAVHLLCQLLADGWEICWEGLNIPCFDEVRWCTLRRQVQE